MRPTSPTTHQRNAIDLANEHATPLMALLVRVVPVEGRGRDVHAKVPNAPVVLGTKVVGCARFRCAQLWYLARRLCGNALVALFQQSRVAECALLLARLGVNERGNAHDSVSAILRWAGHVATEARINGERFVYRLGLGVALLPLPG